MRNTTATLTTIMNDNCQISSFGIVVENLSILDSGYCSKCNFFHSIYKESKVFNDKKYEMKNKLLCFANHVLRETHPIKHQLDSNHFISNKVINTDQQLWLVKSSNLIGVQFKSAITIMEGSYSFQSNNKNLNPQHGVSGLYRLLDDLYFKGVLRNSSIAELNCKDLKFISLIIQGKVDESLLLSHSIDFLKKRIFEVFAQLKFKSYPFDNETNIKFVFKYAKKIIKHKFQENYKVKYPNKPFNKRIFYNYYVKDERIGIHHKDMMIQRFRVMFESPNLTLSSGLFKYKRMREELRDVFKNFIEEMKIYFYSPKISAIKQWLFKADNDITDDFSAITDIDIEMPPLPGVIRVFLAEFYQKYSKYLN